MAEQTFNTRIALKYDTYENWKTNNPVLKAGEFAVAAISTNQDGVQNAPSILIKVGDGTNAYNDLKFTSGLSADVQSWAKAETKPTYTANEIEGLSDYVSGKIQDTNTQYQIVKVDNYNYKLQSKEVNGTWTDVENGAIVIPKYDDTEVKGDIEALEGLVGTTAVATQIANAIAALNLANTYEAKGEAAKVQTALNTYKTSNDERVTTVEGKVNTLIGNDANKSVRTIANEELAAKLIADNASASLDTLAEIAAWIQNHPDDASAMNAAIVALQNQLVGIAAGEGTVKKYVDDAITALKIGDYAKAADLTALAGRVSAAEGMITNLETEVAKKANNADLADIAKTGNVNDLVQTDGDVIIFNCGNSNF